MYDSALSVVPFFKNKMFSACTITGSLMYVIRVRYDEKLLPGVIYLHVLTYQCDYLVLHIINIYGMYAECIDIVIL